MTFLSGAWPLAGLGQTLQLDARETDAAFDALEKEIESESADWDRLRWAHYTEVSRWQGVVPSRPAKGQDLSAFAWKTVSREDTPPRGLVAPVRKGPASTVVAIPDAREYRVWLGYAAEKGQSRPVVLTLSGANEARHVYGAFRLGSAPGGDQEKTLPIRFEDEISRIKAPTGPIMVWEFTDLKLKAGATTLTLESDDPAARVDGVFLCASRSFAPSKSIMPGEANIYRTWCRVRVSQAPKDAKAWSCAGASLGYHWRRIPRGMSEPLWSTSLGPFPGEQGKPLLVVGEWTRWVEVTEDVMEGPWAHGGGDWATGHFSFKGVGEGTCEVQLAWYPHPDAVLKTIASGIAGGGAVCMIPLQPLCVAPVAGTNAPAGVWGMRDPRALARLESAADVHRRHFEWGRAALEKLGGAATNPITRLIRVMTGNGAAAADRETAARMLVLLGINDLRVKDPDLQRTLGEPSVFVSVADSQYLTKSHDPLDPAAARNVEASMRARAAGILKGHEADPPQVRIKMGDEIGAVVGAASINGLETCRKAFHDYLRGRLALLGRSAPEYYGVEDVDDLPYLASLPPRAGLQERRLYYDSARFTFVLTALYYAQFTRAAEKAFPRVHTYCNFSPHPPMFGQNMNGSDWFALTRGGGANMAWGECWAGGNGGWGFTGFEVVSYYAAWVECAARTRGGLPGGFYVVGGMGGSDRKFFSLVARGIHWLQAYSWGPVYAGAEASNFWSENPVVYGQIARGTHALGPADDLIATGAREPRRAAVLYNRTHEIWNGGSGGFQSDRLITYTALSHAHIAADIILEEDCTDALLAPYRVVYVQGYNLAPGTLAALRRWVEAGGVLVGVAGTALRDDSNTPFDEAEALFGARQRVTAVSQGSWHPQSLAEHQPLDVLRLEESDLTPAMTVDVIGVKAELTPTTGKAVGAYTNGACGAVIHALGKGRTLLLGVQPGLLYKAKAVGGSRYMLERRPLVTKPAEVTLGRQRVEYSEPQTETCLFEKEGQAAVTLNNFSSLWEPEKNKPVTLSLQTDLPVKEVVSSMLGPLSWKREGDRIRVELTAPETVDVVIFR